MTDPLVPSTRMRCPARKRVVAFSMPATAGIPYSRATNAPCDIPPPTSMTSAPANKNKGVQPGSVLAATITSPGWRFAPTGECSTRTVPSYTPGGEGRSDEHLGRRGGLRRGSVGDLAVTGEDTGNQAALHLSLKHLTVALRECTQVDALAAQRGAHVDTFDEEDVVALVEQPAGNERRAAALQCASAEGDRPDHVELGPFSQSAEV